MKLEVFQTSCLRQILGVTNVTGYEMIRYTIRHRCMDLLIPLLESKYNGTVFDGSDMCADRTIDFRLPKRLLWAERRDG